MANNNKYINDYKKEHYTVLRAEFKKEDAQNVKQLVVIFSFVISTAL